MMVKTMTYAHQNIQAMSWIDAAKEFYNNKGKELSVFSSLMLKLQKFGLIAFPVTIFDDLGNLLPVINIFTVANNFSWPILGSFAGFALIRIAKIRRNARR